MPRRYHVLSKGPAIHFIQDRGTLDARTGEWALVGDGRFAEQYAALESAVNRAAELNHRERQEAEERARRTADETWRRMTVREMAAERRCA